MKTIKIILNDDGSVLSLSCGFQLNQYSYNDTLLNVYVPSNILENQTDLENVDYSNNVVMGMYYTLANGSQKVGNPYYFTFVKDNVVIDNKLYTLYERKMPKEFTLYYGTQTYCINVVALKTTITNGVATNEVVGNITSNNFELNIVRATNMVDSGIEEDTDLSTLIANVNSLLANMLLKQDKTDSLIQVSIANGSNIKTDNVRLALNYLNQRVAENFTNVTTNTGDITQLKQDVIDINNQLLTSFRYCGSYTSPNAPTNPRLNELMTTWGLTARNGDVIIWTWTITGGTDKSYTCRYNVNNTWDTIEIPTVETASNTEMGLIQGNYDENLIPSGTTPNILASIVGGKIVDIYYKRGNIYHNLQVDFNGIVAELNEILIGTTSVAKSRYATYDISEENSSNPTPINQKYMTNSDGATKQFVTDYALPKTFNDVYRFDFTNNKLVSNSVNTSKTLPTQLGSVDFGSYTIEKTSVLTFELSNKNTFTCNFYAMFDNNIDDVTFTMVIKANDTPIASTTSETTDFTGGTYKKVSINGDFALLGDSEITIDENVTLSVELSANITTSATNNLTIYSNTTLPSAFTLNVASSTIIIGSGAFGGVYYHTLNGVMTNNAVDFALPSNTTLVDETIHTFILDFSGITMGTNTMLYITNGSVRHNLNLPTNYNSGATLSYGNVSQFLAPGGKIVFTAIYDNGFFTIIGGNTLSKAQIQALLNAKQNVIDSSHKLDADLVSDTNSSNKFVSAYLKSLITTNRQDIDLLALYKPYEVQLSDITITGTSVPYPVTLSSALETAILSGKRALFVNGTIMNTLTEGGITTDTFFNVISYDKITQSGYKHIIEFSTYTDNILGGFLTLNAGFLQDDNNQWYVVYKAGGVDTDMINTQIGQLQNDVLDLQSRVTTLENSGGSELYQHHMSLSVLSTAFTLDVYNNSETPFVVNTLRQYLRNLGFTNTSSYFSYRQMFFDGTTNYQIRGLIGSNVNLQIYYYDYSASSATTNNVNALTDTVIKIS